MKIFLFFVLLHNLNFINGITLLSEEKALLSIKSAITYDPFNSLSSWKNTTHHCSWPFITCSSSSSAVISLDISNLNLAGILSPDIGSLIHLQNLSVASNSFYGAIPSSLSLLTQLRYLNLSYNDFTTFPSTFSSLKNLTILDLSYNHFSGRIPLELGNLTNLIYLSGGFCNFSGEIPMELGKLKKLEFLSFDVNTLSGGLPFELGSMKSLKYMDFFNNMLSGVIPESYSILQNITYFNLGENKLHGSIPDFIGDFPELEFLSQS
ncbi:leucine-rich repeat receptor-like serine/threonine-protein kinase BAM1 [Beta vulgaris subsp. vulgaris]|uniref:leucine-rich repeat receptor-like serine/threonine-protein kinase BAM1 n=1 Tax=Beta vulgaris subsp. vulgaris TaxID=3555 RepID=UPI0020375F42|nr:leucine-rich repeat receptor-like serine/threonine-protein kinase BAM1 [Beta vulgaris subsp. vulgaris]